MKSHRLTIALFVLACIVGAVALRHHFRLYYASPETESAFLRSYTPEHVIDRFRKKGSHSHTRNFGSGAGRDSVPHEAGFDFFVVLRRESWMPLMNALRDDALQQLSNNGAEVLSQGGNSQDGFRLEYKINQSMGSLRILPLAINSQIRRNMPLPQGMEDVTVKIDQAEKWFPKKMGTIRVSSAAVSY
jgi:hypothetical protein